MNEHLSLAQMIGSLLVMAAAIALTIEQEKGKFKIKKAVLLMMIVCSLLHSIISLLFKYVAQSENFWSVNFWLYFGYALIGILILIFSAGWRKQFLAIFKNSKAAMISLSLLSEGSSIGANFIFNYALLLMPIALVSVVSNGLQPFFVLLFGVILTILSPKLAHETLSKKNLIPKVIAIAVMFLGTYLLNIS